MSTLAIDIGGTKIAIGFVSNGSLMKRRQFPTPKVQTADEFAKQILDNCRDWLPDVARIGVSTTGLVSEEGISSINPDTLAFPSPFPLKASLQKLADRPVMMLNDAQAAAWFEFVNLDTPIKNMAFITVSTGVGGGLVIDGKLHKGTTGLAGHIGHIAVDPDGPECGCGQRGCVETLASGTAIERISKQIFFPPVSNVHLFSIADEDDMAERIIRQSAGAIATLCTNLKAILDLDVVVIGGGVGLASGYISRVQEAINEKPNFCQVPVVAAKGHYDACLLGAAFQFNELN